MLALPVHAQRMSFFKDMNLVAVLGLSVPLLDACVDGMVTENEINKQASVVVLRSRLHSFNLTYREEHAVR